MSPSNSTPAGPVGILFILIGTGAPPRKLGDYSRQVVESARFARSFNPVLLIGIALDAVGEALIRPSEHPAAYAYTVRLQLSAAAMRGSPWLKRLEGVCLPRFASAIPLAADSQRLPPPRRSACAIAVRADIRA